MARTNPPRGKGRSKAGPRKSGKTDLSLFPSPDSVLGQQYYYVTLRFWPSLVFVLPMLIVFELGTWLTHTAADAGQQQLVAFYLIERLVEVFGRGGFYFPGLLVVAILLACHLVARHPWKFDVWVLAGMLGESLIWTIPLFVLHRMVQSPTLSATMTGHGVWLDEVIRSFGAGIYEELVYRFICMNLLHLLLVDLLRLPRSASSVFVICASAVIFAAQHHPPLGADPFDTAKFAFRTAAGLYLAGLYFFRGFGIAAGCHSFYNVIVVTLVAVRQ